MDAILRMDLHKCVHVVWHHLEFYQLGLALRDYLLKDPLQALLHAMDEDLAPVLRTTWYWHEKTMFRLLLYSTRVCIRPHCSRTTFTLWAEDEEASSALRLVRRQPSPMPCSTRGFALGIFACIAGSSHAVVGNPRERHILSALASGGPSRDSTQEGTPSAKHVPHELTGSARETAIVPADPAAIAGC